MTPLFDLPFHGIPTISISEAFNLHCICNNTKTMNWFFKQRNWWRIDWIQNIWVISLLSSPLLGYRSIIWGGVWRTPHVCWVIWLIDVKLYQRQDRMVELSCWSIRKLYWHTITIRNWEQWTQISTFYLLYLINHESSFQPTGLRGFKNHNLRLLYNIVFPLCLSFLFTVKLKVSVSPSNNTLQILGEFLARIVNKK